MALDGILRQSTTVSVLIGPFVDDSDGNTVEDSLTLSQADIRLSKNGGNMAQKNDSSGCTHDELGYYSCPLDATDSGTLGLLKLIVHESGALPVTHTYLVLPANVYDSLIAGTDYMNVSLVQWLGTAPLALSSQRVQSDPGSVTVGTNNDKTGYGLVDDAITSAKFDESTAFPLVSADNGATQVARVGADGDTLETISDQIDAVPTASEIQLKMEENGASLLDTIRDHIENVTYGLSALKDLLDAVPTAAQIQAEMEEGEASYLYDIWLQVHNRLAYCLEYSGEGPAPWRFTEHSLELAPTGPTASEIQAEMEENGASILGTLNDDLEDGGRIDLLIDAIKAVTDKLSDTLENDGGTYRFTENALEEAPSGTGGDATAANQTTIMDHLTDIKGTGFIKDTDSMVDLAHIGADNDTLETLSDQMDGIGSQAGAGGITWTYTLTDADSGNPISNADVWVTTDEAGNNVIASGVTDAAGSLTFYLDAGTYYLWRKKSGWNFTNPDTEEVSE